MIDCVLVVGDVVDDIVVVPHAAVRHASDTAATIRHVAGGSAANVAAWLARLGTPATFAGRAGVTNAAWHADQLERAGVTAHITADPSLSTGTIVLVLDKRAERTMYVDRGANGAFTAADLPAAAWTGVCWLHLTGYSFFDPGVWPVAIGLIGEARRRGIPVSIDPSSSGFLALVGQAEFLTWTAGADLVVPNRDEAEVLTGAADPERMARRLGEYYPAVVITRG